MIRPDRGHFFILAAAILFGTTGTARALAPEGMSPAFIGALRLVIGGPVLLAATAAGGSPGITAYRVPFGATLLAAAGIAAFQICFFAAVSLTGVAVGTLVAIGSAPLAAGLLEAAFYGERLGRRWLTAAILAISGCTLLAAGQNDLVVEKTGLLLAAGSGAAYAVYQVTTRRLVAGRSPGRVMAVVLCAAGLFMAPFLAGPGIQALVSIHGITAALYLGIFATAGAYALFARGLVTVPVSRAALLALAEPLMAALLGLCLLGEHLSVSALLGILLIIGGLLLVTGQGRLPGPEKALIKR